MLSILSSQCLEKSFSGLPCQPCRTENVLFGIRIDIVNSGHRENCPGAAGHYISSKSFGSVAQTF